jgi:hypothetical protein
MNWKIRSLPVAAAGLAAVVIVAGCGSSSSSSGSTNKKAVNPNSAEVSPAGDIPDNQAYVAYSPPGGGFSVKVPEGWSRTSAGGAVTFTDKLNSVKMESLPASKAPTVATYKSSEEPAVAKGVSGYKAGPVTSVSRTGGKAVRAVYYATSQPNAVTGKVTTDTVERYEFFKNGKEVVLTLTGAKGADNVDPWKIVTDSLRFQ